MDNVDGNVFLFTLEDNLCYSIALQTAVTMNVCYQ